MRDIYVCVIFLRVKIYWMFFYWSHFFDVHFSYCEVFMCQVFPDTVNFSKDIEIDSEKGLIPDWGELKMNLYVTASRTVKPITATPTAFPTSQKSTYRDEFVRHDKSIPTGTCFRFHSRESRCETLNCSWSHYTATSVEGNTRCITSTTKEH